MYWFRHHYRNLLRLTLGVWVLALIVTSGGLKYCADAAKAINPASQIPTLELVSLALALLLPAMMMLNPAQTITFAALALKRPTPSGPPARLIFVRFND